MRKLLIATHNPGKMREIRMLLDMPELELITPAQIGLSMEVAETGNTYAENAALKAQFFAKVAHLLTLADDSGLEVDALDGQPGLHSARFLNRLDATDADRRKELLRRLKGYSRPWQARFRCLVAVADPMGETKFVEGICEGQIIPEERGQNGFGYDPIFWIPELGRTMAELSMEEKNKISHRARAIRSAKPILAGYLAKL